MTTAQLWELTVTDDFIHDPRGYKVQELYIPSLDIAISKDRIFEVKKNRYYWNPSECSSKVN